MFDWMPLVGLSENDLSRIGIVAVNQACASGLPGTNQIRNDVVARRIEFFADSVRRATTKLKPQFESQQAYFHNSFAYFQVLCLVTVLQRDCGIRYDPTKIADDAPFTPGDSFLFGLVKRNMGTCANIPILYAAVGRQLGYPIKIVRAKGKCATHLFARWDDGKGGCFNIEATSEGLRCPPDDYYRTGRYQISSDIERKGEFLESMTPRGELAHFMAERSCCWQNVGNYRRAAEAMVWASSLAPNNAFYFNTVKMILNDWTRALDARKPRGFPQIFVKSMGRRFPLFSLDNERYIFGLEAFENMLNNPEHDRTWWEPMRLGNAIPNAPVQAIAEFRPGKCTIQFRFPGKKSNPVNQKGN